MKHLNDDERLALIEGRGSAESTEHLKNCGECAGEVSAMRESVARLESLSWPAPMRKRQALGQPFFRWAAAAAILLCAGIAIGRASGPNAEEIKTQVAREVRETLRRETLAMIKIEAQKPSAEVMTLLTQIREQQAANYLSLRNDLETLASNADARLQSTGRQLVELASRNP